MATPSPMPVLWRRSRSASASSSACSSDPTRERCTPPTGAELLSCRRRRPTHPRECVGQRAFRIGAWGLRALPPLLRVAATRGLRARLRGFRFPRFLGRGLLLLLLDRALGGGRRHRHRRSGRALFRLDRVAPPTLLRLGRALLTADLTFELRDDAIDGHVHVLAGLFGLEVGTPSGEARLGDVLEPIDRQGHLRRHGLSEELLELAHLFSCVGLDSSARCHVPEGDADVQG